MYPPQRQKDSSVNRFIDFDKSKSLFYDNLYLGEQKIVVKVPICNDFKSQKKPVQDFCRNPKIEPFNLTKYTYLCSY